MADPGRLRATVEHLAAFERPPCSVGEQEAAAWIAEELARQGCPARLEPERVYGSFHTPIGLLAAIAALGGALALHGHRRAGALAGAFAAGSMWEDLSGGARRPFRRALPQGIAHNV